MLTVDFDGSGLLPGERLLDLGSGGGRHAFEAMRRGARVTALDYSAADLKDVAAVAGAMLDARRGRRTTQWAGVVNGDALDLPFPDDAFDRVIVSEVLEHIWDDERALAEIARVAAARADASRRRCRRAGPSACRGRSTGATTTRPAVTSASTASTSSSRSSNAPASSTAARTTRTRSTRRTGG